MARRRPALSVLTWERPDGRSAQVLQHRLGDALLCFTSTAAAFLAVLE